MPDPEIGSEQFNDEDRQYAGSRFSEVVDALFANPYQKVWGREGEPPLPLQDVTMALVGKLFPTLDPHHTTPLRTADRGDARPKRALAFTIEVTDDGKTSGTAFRVRRTFRNWRRIGSLVFDNAVVSYNGDAVIHFAHPTWRQDRNDPATATRVDGVKVG
ncbi:MAG: hypothetical protein ABI652_05675 [Acidobacteriota bacterium]